MASKVQSTQTAKFSRNNVIEQLPSLICSKEEMKSLHDKLLHYESEQAMFKKKLEKYMRITGDRRLLEAEMLKRREKLLALQKALGQLQNAVFQERENRIKIQAEVESLKINEEDLHRRIQQLLRMTKDKKLRDDLLYIFDDTMKVHISQRLFSTSQNDREQTQVKAVGEEDSSHTLRRSGMPNEVLNCKDRTDAARKFIEKKTELSNQKVEAITKDCVLRVQEAENLHVEDRQQIQNLIENFGEEKSKVALDENKLRTIDLGFNSLPRLKETEENLVLTNTELLNVTARLRREEILREMQKSVLVNHISDAVKTISLDGNVQDVVNQVMHVLEESSELFESVENLDMSALLACELPTTDKPFKNGMCFTIQPQKVQSQTLPKRSEFISSINSNSSSNSVNSGLQHAESTGQFIRFQPKCSHCPCVRDAVNIQKSNYVSSVCQVPLTLVNHNKAKFERISDSRKVSSAEHLNGHRNNSSIAPKVQLTRPKSADPRLRKPIYDENSQADFINSKKSASTTLRKTGGKSTDRPEQFPKIMYPSKRGAGDSHKQSHLQNGYTTSKGILKSLTLLSRHRSQVQSCKTGLASPKHVRLKSSPTIFSSEIAVQCNLNGNGSLFSNHYNLNAHEKKTPLVSILKPSQKFIDETEVENFTSTKPSGLFVHRAESPPSKMHHVGVSTSHDAESVASSLSESNGNSFVSPSDPLNSNFEERELLRSNKPESSSIFHRYYKEKLTELKETIEKLNTELQELHAQFCQKECLIQQYEEYCRTLEKEKQEQQNEITARETEKEAIAEQLKTTKARLQKVEAYRRLQLEGFGTDVKMVTAKIREIEKELHKSLLLFGKGEKDLELLEIMHTSTKKACQVSNTVKRLKAELYRLESDLRHV